MSASPIEDRWVIKAAGRLVGIVVYAERGWVFFAAASGVWDLNGRIFEDVRDAEKAVQQHLAGQLISTAAKPNAF